MDCFLIFSSYALIRSSDISGSMLNVTLIYSNTGTSLWYKLEWLIANVLRLCF